MLERSSGFRALAGCSCPDASMSDMTAASQARVRRAEGTWNRESSVTKLQYYTDMLPGAHCFELAHGTFMLELCLPRSCCLPSFPRVCTSPLLANAVARVSYFSSLMEAS